MDTHVLHNVDSTDPVPVSQGSFRSPKSIQLNIPSMPRTHKYCITFEPKGIVGSDCMSFLPELGHRHLLKAMYLLILDWLVGCFWLNGPLRQYFSLYRAVSRRKGERKEITDERKNVQTTPTSIHCKRSRPLPYYDPN